MPEEDIPCGDCENKKENIEEAGDATVISCEPIPEKPGWCKIIWEYIE